MRMTILDQEYKFIYLFTYLFMVALTVWDLVSGMFIKLFWFSLFLYLNSSQQ